jgi:hypothetical protein
MSAISEALYNRLASDVQLAAMLSNYHGHPAIFTADLAPQDAELPYIVAAGEGGGTSFDTKTSQGMRVVRDIRCYAEQNDTATTVEAIAERVRELLHRQPLIMTGYTMDVLDAGIPTQNPETDAYGRRVVLTMLVRIT